MHGTPFVFPNDAHVTWSIMIVLYPYITGLVAGAFVVSALYHVFQNHALRPVARLSLVMALCFCAFATLPLLLHLHHPERAFNIMITPNASSAMAGFGFIYSLYMLLLCVEVWLIFRTEIVELAAVTGGIPGRILKIMALGSSEITPGSRLVDQRLIGGLAVLGIPAACVLHGYVGFLFGGIKANPWWSTALMPVIFLASAIVSGIAALLLFYLILSRFRKESVDSACVQALLKNLWIALVIAFTLEMLELLHMAYEAGSDWHVIRTLLTEHLAFSYGIVQILIGSIVPLILLPIAFRLQRHPGIMKAMGAFCSVLVLVQVFAMRWNVVIGGQMFSKSHRGFVEYHLAWGGREGLVAAMVVLLLPVIALLFAGRRLPLQESH